jgi:hypothetical protein
MSATSKTTVEPVATPVENTQATPEKSFKSNLLKSLGIHAFPGYGQGDREKDARMAGIYAAASEEARRALDEAFRTATRGKSLRDLLSTLGTFRE